MFRVVLCDFNSTVIYHLHQNYLSIPNFNSSTVEVWEWKSNFIPHFARRVDMSLIVSQITSNLIVFFNRHACNRENIKVSHYWTFVTVRLSPQRAIVVWSVSEAEYIVHLHGNGKFSALLALCEGPVTHSFDVFFDLRLNKRLSRQSRRRWFMTPSRSLCRHCNMNCVCHGCDLLGLTGNPLRTDAHGYDTKTYLIAS